MKHHVFGRLPFTVTEVGFGAWAIGGAWGESTKTTAARRCMRRSTRA